MSKQTARENQLMIEYKYGKTHLIKKMFGTEFNLKNLEPNESVVWGDGKTYYWKLTKKI